jgi:type VI secretion system secreted protein Hcp
MALFDAFLKLTGIKGESADAKHKGEIDILSFSVGASQTGHGHVGGGSGAGKIDVADIVITKYVDAATVDLFKYCATGKHIDEAVLVCRKAGGTPLEFLKYTMKQVLISRVDIAGSSQGDVRPHETISLHFRSFEQTYTPQDEKGGAKPSSKFGYDLAQAKET